MERTTALAEKNPERLARLEAEAYGPKAKWIRTLRCYVTGRDAPSVAAHVRSRGAGGKSGDVVPFHALVEIDWHNLVEAKFEEKYGISKQDCKDAAERYEARWQAMQRGTVDVEF